MEQRRPTYVVHYGISRRDTVHDETIADLESHLNRCAPTGYRLSSTQMVSGRWLLVWEVES